MHTAEAVANERVGGGMVADRSCTDSQKQNAAEQLCRAQSERRSSHRSYTVLLPSAWFVAE